MKLLCALLAVGCIGQTRPAYMPDPKLTPGVADPKLTKDVICGSGWSTKSVRHTSGALKAKVYRSYGITKHAPGEYEIDHLISMEIGGADVQANLWPEPYHGEFNAHIKDRLENELHREVCSDKADLATVQREISTDWVACYRKHLGEPPSGK